MATSSVPVSSRDHVQGDEGAGVTLVEYGDYECPHCAHAYPIIKQVQRHFGQDLRFVFRNFPLNEIHPSAQAAAESAEFAADGGRFWEMHDAIFENQENIGLSLFLNLAQELQLSVAGLEQALAAQTYLPRIRDDFMGGVRSGVNGTPSFFINGRRHDGSFQIEALTSAIQAHL
jgi:protein-disulfide isomerase